MQIIRPLDLDDFRRLFGVQADVNVEIQADWIQRLTLDEMERLCLKCPASWPVLASSQDTPAGILEVLARKADWGVLISVGGNPRTPVDTLAWLTDRFINVKDDSKYFTEQILARIGSNPSASAVTLSKIGRHASPKVRCAAAENPATPVEVITLLSRDADLVVQISVARNQAVPTALLELWANSAIYSLRAEVALNPSTPLEILRKLAADADPEVRVALAANPSTPVELLRRLATDPSGLVVKAVAESPKAPQDVLVRLARHPDWPVRACVAKNIHTPSHVRRRLRRDEYQWVREATGRVERTESRPGTSRWLWVAIALLLACLILMSLAFLGPLIGSLLGG